MKPVNLLLLAVISLLLGAVYFTFLLDPHWREHWSYVTLALLFPAAYLALKLTRRYSGSAQQREDLRNELEVQERNVLEIYLPPSQCNWQSEPILEAAGELMEGLGYELEPELDAMEATQRISPC